VATIGKLDGVHAGHRHLAARVLHEADARSVMAAALVLHPDPRAVVAGTEVPMLSTVADRIRRLRAFGLDLVEPLHFTADIAALSPEAFVARLLDRFRLAAVVAGPDFRFGRARSGDVRTLERLGRQHDFAVVVAPPLTESGEPVSSRRLRAMVEAGDVQRARTLMRRPPRLTGIVVHGAARGRALGFATANLDPRAAFVMPANGIYTVRASWRRADSAAWRTADGVASIGVRPTFGSGERLVEVHLLDTDEDLYGRRLTVRFLSRQRDELRFDSVGALVAQMHRDVERARADLAFEAQVARGAVLDGSGLRVVGHDLADVCRALAEALLQRPPGSATERPVRRPVSLEGTGAANVVRGWLAALAAGGQDQPVWAAPDVYYASERCLHAVVAESASAAPSTPARAARLESLTRTDRGLEAVVYVADRTPPAPGAAFPR